MSVTGPPGGGPWRVGIAISDTVAGTFLCQAVLAALVARARTGRGQWVQTSLLETMVNIMDFQAVRYLNEGDVPGQAGNDHPTLFPMGTYETADGWVNIAGMMHLGRFLSVLGLDGLSMDDRAVFRSTCEERLRSQPTAHWVEAMAAVDIPAGPVYSVDEVFADAQVAQLGMAVEVPGVGGEPIQVLRHPASMSLTPTAVQGGPPSPGEHTRAVLAEAGYDDAAIDALIASGAAASTRAARGWSADRT
jgi:crotonobetainyl-CoA:carnitine CoA-transferase CaiB-like acyl-CoA transferase